MDKILQKSIWNKYSNACVKYYTEYLFTIRILKLKIGSFLNKIFNIIINYTYGNSYLLK